MESTAETDHDETPDAKPAPAAVIVPPNPDALAQLEAKFTAKASEGGKPRGIRRRTCEVPITPDMCEPDTITEPVMIGLEGLSSKQEMEALKAASDGLSMGYEMARLSMRTMNGAMMRNHQRAFVWEILSLGGRTALVSAYLSQCCGVVQGGLGNSLGVTVG